MHSCKLFGIYPHSCEYRLSASFPWLVSERVYLPKCKVSNRLMTSELNNGQWKADVVNMSIPLKLTTVYEEYDQNENKI